MAEIHNESDLSVLSLPNQSMSTDSEESFLMKQINKSQLFNNSSSSGSSKQRRSYFRESYIDEDGTMKNFSVYQDVINETSDESRDISLTGLSSLNIENVIHGTEPRNTQLQNILSEVDNNNTNRVRGHRKTHSTSRSDSLMEQQRTTHKRMSGSSFRISAYGNIPDPRSAGSDNSHSHSHSHSSGASFRTASEHSGRAPSSNYGSLVSPREPPLRQPSPAPEIALPPLVQTEIERPIMRASDYDAMHRVPTPEYPAPAPPELRGVPALYDQNELTLAALTNLAQVTRDHTPTSVGSYKSSRSQTRESILNFEETRRRQKGTPVVFVQNPQASRSNVRFHDSDQAGQIRANVTAENVDDAGVTPSIHSPSSDNFPLVDDASIKQSRRARMHSGQALVKKPAGLKEFKLRPPTEKKEDITKVIPYYKREPNEEGEYPSDELLEKMKYDRENREPYEPRTQSMAWIVYFLSFVVPPGFFFLGLGTLDQHLGAVDAHIKRLSLLTGTLVLMIVLAMVGVGFGVGLSRE